ncbi:MAG: hypothetical protein MJZ13_01955 [Bacteroidales bacterium]|nr:hypothetical protein [Bacteroidales bacterium]
MKKHLLFALGIACAATCFTACHDDNGDEDGDGNVTSNFADNVSVATFPSMMVQYVSSTGVVPYMLSDGNIQVFHYTTGEPENNPVYNSFFATGSTVTEGEDSGDESVAVEKTALSSSDFPNLYEESTGNYFYGGFTPTWGAKVGEEDAADFTTPIDGTYANNFNCLLANPGMVCKALFTKNFSSIMANATLKKIMSVSVQAPVIYNSYAKNDTETLEAWSMPTTLPANIRIEAVAYGYVESFSIKKLSDALKALKGAASGVAAGGIEEGAVTLIETDENGKVTKVCDKWETIKFGKKTYMGEIYIRVIDKKTGKTAETDYLGTEGDYSLLNYVLVDKITFEGRSLLGLF